MKRDAKGVDRMTEKLRAAARQALEALEFEADGWEYPPPKTTAAITALREALAEPEPRNQCGETCERAKLCAICARGIVEAEQQEPVAWMVYTLDGTSACVTDNPADFTDEHRALPLYTEPFPTDEALLREALYALEYANDMTKPEDLQGCECPICTNIAALRERLGVTA